MLPVFLALLVLVGVMIWASRILVEAFESMVSKLDGRAKFVMSAIVVALGTSIPELVLALSSAMENQGQLSVGNLMGANVANVSLLVGVAAVIAGGLSVVGDFMKYELAATFVAGAAPLILLMDGELSRLDGLILLVVYLIYFRDLVLTDKHKVVGKGLLKRAKFMYEIRKIHITKDKKIYVKLIFSMMVLAISGDMVVRMAIGLVKMLLVSPVVVGAGLLALGTTIPELILSYTAIKRKQVALVFGNLLGSVVTNATLIMGILAILRPVSVVSAPNLAIANLSFVLLFGLLWLFANTKKRLEAWEGLVMIGCFLMTLGLQFMAR